MVKPNRSSESNKALIMGLITYLPCVLSVLIELIAAKKLKTSKTFFLQSFLLWFIILGIMCVSHLPNIFDRILDLLHFMPSNIRLMSYSPDIFRRVIMAHH